MNFAKRESLCSAPDSERAANSTKEGKISLMPQIESRLSAESILHERGIVGALKPISLGF
jgi:hypothetical protein